MTKVQISYMTKYGYDINALFPFRLHAVVPFNARWFTEDKNIAGYKIPANVCIVLVFFLMSSER